MNEGWIKLFRKFSDWEWYTDIPTKCLFIHLLLLANHQPRKWRGQTVNTGELITSIGSLVNGTGLTEQQIRTAIKKLESTGEIERKATNKNTIIIVLNYKQYQGMEYTEQQTNNKPNNNQITIKQQSNNNQITTNKNIRIKELKNERNNITSETPAREAIWDYAPDVLMTDEQACKLVEWCSPEELEQYVVNLQEYITEGHKVHNCFETICRWKERDSTTRRMGYDG